MRLIKRLLQRVHPAAEDGFTMVVALGALVMITVMSVVAFTAVTGSIQLTSTNSSENQAYQAAQAGIQTYLFDLDENNEYWTQCVPTPADGINLGGSTANTRTVPGAPVESYAIELMPAPGYTQCSTTNPVNSMIQATGNGAGSLRIRVTGYAGKAHRTIVASLREASFLDYVWFTNYETSDPIVQVANAYSTSGDKTLQPGGTNYAAAIAGATAQCGKWRYPPYNRYSANFYGSYACDSINFISADSIKGPFHTNDQAQLCGTPTFGRTSADNIEFGYSPGWVQTCTGNPTMNGTTVAPAGILQPPPSNASLQSLATLSFTGTTCITLNASSITVAQPNTSYPSCFSAGIPTSSYSYPSNGVLYVANATTPACSLTYDFENPSYTGNTGCGTAYVSGTAGSPITIAAENDVVIDNNILTSGSNTLVGLIANNFVRVYHPIGNQPLGTNTSTCTSTSTNAPGSMTNVTIDAMLLSLRHSVIVDQYNCGGKLGTLTINGGLAQDFRGAVGTGSGGSVGTGYAKNYNYDDRLRYEEPPHFIDPVQGSWRVQREDECSPAAGTC